MKRKQTQFEVTIDRHHPSFASISYLREKDALVYARICSARFPQHTFTVTRHQYSTATIRYVVYDTSVLEVVYKDAE